MVGVVEGEGTAWWRWWKRKGRVRCAVVVVEGAECGVQWWRWLEVEDDPNIWGLLARERERRKRESRACSACWAGKFFLL